MSQAAALFLSFLPIVVFAGVYIVHLVEEARGVGAGDSANERGESCSGETDKAPELFEEVRDLRLELRALREVLERGYGGQR